MTHFTDALENIKNYSVYVLAALADSETPDWDSPGSRFLESVRGEILERVEHATFDPDRFDFERVSSDWPWEIADQAPSDYTTERWLQFVDLGAYREEPEEGWPGDLTDAAALALYLIAGRLASALLAEIVDAIDADAILEDEDEDED
jgi:hypothetical protein